MNRRLFLTGMVLGACSSSAQARRRWKRLRMRRKQQAEEEAPAERLSGEEAEICRVQRRRLFLQQGQLKVYQKALPSKRMVDAFPEMAEQHDQLAGSIAQWRRSAAAYNARCTVKYHRFNGQWFRSPPLTY